MEKDLGSEFDKIPYQENQRQEDNARDEQSLQAEYNEFNDLINTTILPVMIGYKNQLRHKSIKADILEVPYRAMKRLIRRVLNSLCMK